MEHRISQAKVEEYRRYLKEEERSRATIEKYIHDIEEFRHYAGEGGLVEKEQVIRYKETLTDQYAASSVNAKLAALNGFFKWMGWYDCVVKFLKVQRQTFRSREREMTREEYYRLLKVAQEEKKQRLYLLMQTICSTGIRVSELRFITVEALAARRAVVSLKGKTRTVILPMELCRQLRRYTREQNIRTGSIFVTRNKRPLDRSNILHDMKSLCDRAGVEPCKVFPHNLRHLFACTYYRMEKDLSHLADLLGHSSVNTTRIYTLISGEEQERKVDQLGLVV